MDRANVGGTCTTLVKTRKEVQFLLKVLLTAGIFFTAIKKRKKECRRKAEKIHLNVLYITHRVGKKLEVYSLTCCFTLSRVWIGEREEICYCYSTCFLVCASVLFCFLFWKKGIFLILSRRIFRVSHEIVRKMHFFLDIAILVTDYDVV